jgi:hypothetical protein
MVRVRKPRNLAQVRGEEATGIVKTNHETEQNAISYRRNFLQVRILQYIERTRDKLKSTASRDGSLSTTLLRML